MRVVRGLSFAVIDVLTGISLGGATACPRLSPGRVLPS